MVPVNNGRGGKRGERNWLPYSITVAPGRWVRYLLMQPVNIFSLRGYYTFFEIGGVRCLLFFHLYISSFFSSLGREAHRSLVGGQLFKNVDFWWYCPLMYMYMIFAYIFDYIRTLSDASRSWNIFFRFPLSVLPSVNTHVCINKFVYMYICMQCMYVCMYIYQCISAAHR